MLESLASVLLLFLVIAMLLALMQGGPTGIGTWLHAKFIGGA